MALVLLLQTFSRETVVVAFYANQTNIAKNLCENRGRPQMLCCGKCLLRKRLTAEDKNQKDAPALKFMQLAAISAKSYYATLPAAPARALTIRFPHFAESLLAGEPSACFHPPGFAAC